MKRLGGLVALAAFAVFVHLAPGCVGDDPGVSSGDDGGADGASGAANGAACAGGGDCASGNCADGVCCDTACSGTCEACNLPGQVGTCAPVPDGQDPANECPTTPLGDAGTATGGDDAGASDGGDAAAPFTVPDAGLASDDKPCAGACNGKRACGFPGTEKTCGTVFCGNASTQGRASCDGAGHCLFGAEDCKAYSCPDGSKGCKTTCASEADCAPGHYCDATTNTCKPRAGDGAACTTAVQCASGYCKDSVCCNDACDIANGTCAKPGFVGKCVCSACPTGTCALWYRDADNDGHGDENGTVANNNAMYGCAGGPPPAAGFVESHDDCYDKNDAVGPNVHPGQGNWFSNPYTPILGGSPTWDYDCNGQRDTLVPEVPGSNGCGACGPTGGMVLGCTNFTSCSAAGKQTTLDCHPKGVAVNQCVGSFTYGFRTMVTCGQTSTKYTCGTCAGAGAVPYTTTPNTLQQCH